MRVRGLAISMALALALGAGVMFGSYALADNSADDPFSSPGSSEIRRNENGLTYGSAAFARTPDEEPDLILVVATNGQDGYVYKTELDGDLPSNPQEALRAESEARLIPVYQSDGVTRVGVFEASSPNTSVKSTTD